ncbi:MAG: XkdF-like putative serine protease domain-containing protein [Bacteroidota bacterium]
MLNRNNIPVYQIILGADDEDITGVSVISFVESPATGSRFVALSEHCLHKNLQEDPDNLPLLLKSDEKHIVSGAVLVPDKLLLRRDESGQPFYITFSAGVIEQIRNKFFRMGYTSSTSDEHSLPLHKNHIVESWIVESPETDKAAFIGLGALPKGTWVVSYKVNDPAYWEKEIKTGKRRGFSLEGFFRMAKPGDKNLNLHNMNLTQAGLNAATLPNSFIPAASAFTGPITVAGLQNGWARLRRILRDAARLFDDIVSPLPNPHENEPDNEPETKPGNDSEYESAENTLNDSAEVNENQAGQKEDKAAPAHSGMAKPVRRARKPVVAVTEPEPAAGQKAEPGAENLNLAAESPADELAEAAGEITNEPEDTFFPGQDTGEEDAADPDSEDEAAVVKEVQGVKARTQQALEENERLRLEMTRLRKEMEALAAAPAAQPVERNPVPAKKLSAADAYLNELKRLREKY